MFDKQNLKRILFSSFFFLVPVVLLVFAELALRILDYGVSTEPFYESRDITNFYIKNYNIYEKYFPTTIKRNYIINETIFEKKKDMNVLRFFVIGESTPQGFPFEMNHSFAKMAELALQKTGAYKGVECVNMSYSAMTSYYLKDMGLKLLKYNPDILVVYAGHNEYFGTIGALSGGNHLTKSLYVALKDWRLFQFLFNLIMPGKAEVGADTMMAQQFGNKKVKLSRSFDEKVADNFIKNLDVVVKAYQKRNIPVIVIEPICNLLDMPPFSGEKDKEYSNFIFGYRQAVVSNDSEAIGEYYRQTEFHPEYLSNANILYLNAEAKRILKLNPSISDFIIAKDMDTTPFRVKSVLIEKLRGYIGKHTNYSKLNYIELNAAVYKKYGPEGFGNMLFVDQLHFNEKGQRFVAAELAKRIAGMGKCFPETYGKIDDFLSNETELNREIFFLPSYQAVAYYKIYRLVGSPPFTLMQIPFRLNMPKNNEIFENKELMNKVKENLMQRQDKDFYAALQDTVLNYYLDRHEFEKYEEQLKSYRFAYPAESWAYLSLAKYYAIRRMKANEAVFNFGMSYLLSGKNSDIFNEIMYYFPDYARSLEKNK